MFKKTRWAKGEKIRASLFFNPVQDDIGPFVMENVIIIQLSLSLFVYFLLLSGCFFLFIQIRYLDLQTAFFTEEEGEVSQFRNWKEKKWLWLQNN